MGHPLVLVPGSSGDHGTALFYSVHPGLGWTQGVQTPGGVVYGPVVGYPQCLDPGEQWSLWGKAGVPWIPWEWWWV